MAQMPQLPTTKTGVRPATRAASASCSASRTQQRGPWSSAGSSPAASSLSSSAAGRHCYCCMQFFAGAVDTKSIKVDGHVWCRACSHQVHGDRRGNGGQHPEFATSARPNDRCSAGCSGCSA
jgi:hypothetical protein